MPRIELLGVSKRFGKIAALRNVTFTVEDGQYVCVLGSTGAGKTTLLKVIAGILRPEKGLVKIDGKVVNNVPPELRGVGYFPQTYALFPHLKAWENVAYPLFISGVDRETARDRSLEILRLVGLEARPDSYPHEFSGGMKQRLALARALASDAKILLLDEPLGALDAILALELRYELRKIARKLGLTVIHVTHNQEEALSIADKLIILRRGTVVFEGSPKEAYENPPSLYVANFIGEMNFFRGFCYEENSGCVVETEEGLVFHSAYPPPSRRVVLAFRPDRILLGRGETNVFEGTVKSVSISGAIVRYEVSVPPATIVIKTIARGTILQPNSGVIFSVPPRDVLVFPYPRRGLMAALEVE